MTLRSNPVAAARVGHQFPTPRFFKVLEFAKRQTLTSAEIGKGASKARGHTYSVAKAAESVYCIEHL